MESVDTSKSITIEVLRDFIEKAEKFLGDR